MNAIKIVTCPRTKCGHQWVSRVENPVQCPMCKRNLPKQAEHDVYEGHDELRRFPRKPSDQDGEEVTR